MMLDTIINLAFFALTYYVGRRVGFRRGHNEAEAHSRHSFVGQLRFRKQLLDNTLRSSMVSPAGHIELVVNGEIIAQGTLQDVAKKSLELDELIKTIDIVLPV